MVIGIISVVIIVLVIAGVIWKVTGHDFRTIFNFFKKIFEPPRPVHRPSSTDTADASPKNDPVKLEHEVKLESGGLLKLSCDTDVFKMSQNDRNFIGSILNIINTYEGEDKKK